MEIAKARKPRSTYAQIAEMINYWTSVRRYGTKFSSITDSSLTSRLAIPSRSGGKETIRASLTATLNVPKEDLIQRGRKVNFIFDIPRGKTVGDIREEVRQKILEWLQRYYDVRESTLGRRKVNISFTGLESI